MPDQKISARSIKESLTGDEKIPLGTPDNEATTPDQLKAYATNGIGPITTRNITIDAGNIVIPIGSTSSIAARVAKFNVTTPLEASQNIIINDSGDGEEFFICLTSDSTGDFNVVLPLDPPIFFRAPDSGSSLNTIFIGLDAGNFAIFHFIKFNTSWTCYITSPYLTQF